MDIRFIDSGGMDKLYPFTTTRHPADIRVGILTIREKWALLSGQVAKGFALPVPGNFIPTQNFLIGALAQLEQGEAIVFDEDQTLEHPWDIFRLNDTAIRQDFELITNGRASEPLQASNQASGINSIFIEEGARVAHSILNATAGPIYIGKSVEIMEGCLIRGPVAICEGSVLKMGTRIYGATTVGPYCTVGGEIKNVVMFGFSNKAHDGYLGDSVIGEWCNLGAGTSNSNVLNTAGIVHAWDNGSKTYIPVGLKCGLLMGDYSRAAINTSFNTGTTVGVCCNIFGPGFPPKLVPDFSWGKERYTFEKAVTHVANWKKLKGHALSDSEQNVLQKLYNNQ
jgi:UDP-N-acetylglucosamine diphosphorylase/glucosamine-1-phosphate N-acetyltransferase